MKKFPIVVLIAATFLIACQNPTSANVKVDQTTSDPVTVTDVSDVNKADTLIPDHHISKEVLAAYLEMKNAFTADQSKAAAAAGPKLMIALDNLVNAPELAAHKTELADIVSDAREHAEHIGENASNIKHQREHFQALSTDMYDLIKLAGTSQTVYKDSCPMVKAIWISEKKEIVNPYYGKEMLTCGKIQETIER